MSAEEWEVVEEAAGALQAEVLRGLLEAQGVQVVLSQEGAGHWVYAVTVGPLGRVQILVPVEQLETARQILEDYRAGAYQDLEFPVDPEAGEGSVDTSDEKE